MLSRKVRAEHGWRLAAVAAALGGLAVALGAFGTHGLADAVSPDRLATWRTAAQYHLVHALAAVGAGVLAAMRGSSSARWAGWLFLAGVVLFSGSLYALVLLDLGVLGAVAPLGGLAFVAGWGALAAALWRDGERKGLS
ncbi:DUF423 domain-containing protein [Rubrivirga sp.]|uniref:DUF423 domain-containing protein n=1 Tax=Rubrivirga sp. TaxID=1885344 RepID=UPI003B52F9EF